jgi:hypothetical protein
MPYVDLNTIHNPSTGGIAPASWGDQARDNFEFLIDPPTCSVKAAVAQLLTSGVTTVLAAGAESFDNDGMHSTVTNTSRITIQTPGRYLITALARYAVNATGDRHLGLRVNGAGNHDLVSVLAAPTFDTFLAGTKSFVFAAGDYLEVRATQNSGGNLNVTLEDFTAVFITR